MKVRIQKWGNSLALRIPKVFAKETNIESGSQVELQLEDHHLIIKPIIGESEYDLDYMLSGINETNIHHEIDFGEPVGRELL